MAALGEILELREDKGVAGQLMYTVRVRYSSHDMTVGFVGGIYGRPGPVVMVHGNVQFIVDNAERFGERFNEDWVRAFYASDPMENHEIAHKTKAICAHCGEIILRVTTSDPWFHGHGGLSIWCSARGGPKAQPYGSSS
jgi:hypothetical protein